MQSQSAIAHHGYVLIAIWCENSSKSASHSDTRNDPEFETRPKIEMQIEGLITRL